MREEHSALQRERLDSLMLSKILQYSQTSRCSCMSDYATVWWVLLRKSLSAMPKYFLWLWIYAPADQNHPEARSSLIHDLTKPLT